MCWYPDVSPVFKDIPWAHLPHQASFIHQLRGQLTSLFCSLTKETPEGRTLWVSATSTLSCHFRVGKAPPCFPEVETDAQKDAVNWPRPHSCIAEAARLDPESPNCGRFFRFVQTPPESGNPSNNPLPLSSWLVVSLYHLLLFLIQAG